MSKSTLDRVVTSDPLEDIREIIAATVKREGGGKSYAFVNKLNDYYGSEVISTSTFNRFERTGLDGGNKKVDKGMLALISPYTYSEQFDRPFFPHELFAIADGKPIADEDGRPIYMPATLDDKKEDFIERFELEYLVKKGLWNGAFRLNGLNGSEGQVRHQKLIDLMRRRKEELGEDRFISLCHDCRIRPDELDAAWNGYLPSKSCVGVFTALLQVPDRELQQYVYVPDASSAES